MNRLISLAAGALVILIAPAVSHAWPFQTKPKPPAPPALNRPPSPKPPLPAFKITKF